MSNLQKFIVLDGTVKSEDGLKKRGDVVEFDPEEIKAIDPKGTEFCTPEQWEFIKKSDEAAHSLKELKAGRNPKSEVKVEHKPEMHAPVRPGGK